MTTCADQRRERTRQPRHSAMLTAPSGAVYTESVRQQLAALRQRGQEGQVELRRDHVRELGRLAPHLQAGRAPRAREPGHEGRTRPLEVESPAPGGGVSLEGL